MGILDTIMNFIYQIICYFYDTFDKCKLIVSEESIDLKITPPPETTRTKRTTSSPETITSTICPTDTCVHDSSSNEYTMPYFSELNLNSSCDEIKDYIISNLERRYPNVFQSSDNTPISDAMKKELIFILENRSDMIFDPPFTNPTGEQITTGSGIRFKFCCPTEEHCLL